MKVQSIKSDQWRTLLRCSEAIYFEKNASEPPVNREWAECLVLGASIGGRLALCRRPDDCNRTDYSNETQLLCWSCVGICSLIAHGQRRWSRAIGTLHLPPLKIGQELEPNPLAWSVQEHSYCPEGCYCGSACQWTSDVWWSDDCR